MCMPHSRSLLFFFFNDTATTEIYTLSLHDALPISPARLEALAHEELAVQRTSVLVLDELHAMLNSPARQQKQFMASLKRLSNMRQLSIVACGTVDVSRADRKSTRLNSSHGYISYAVFCLNKNDSVSAARWA